MFPIVAVFNLSYNGLGNLDLLFGILITVPRTDKKTEFSQPQSFKSWLRHQRLC